MIPFCASNYLNRTIPKGFLKTANSLTLFQHSCGMPKTFNSFLLRDASFLHPFPSVISKDDFHLEYIIIAHTTCTSPRTYAIIIAQLCPPLPFPKNY